jgi:hypothetical protein
MIKKNYATEIASLKHTIDEAFKLAADINFDRVKRLDQIETLKQIIKMLSVEMRTLINHAKDWENNLGVRDTGIIEDAEDALKNINSMMK